MNQGKILRCLLTSINDSVRLCGINWSLMNVFMGLCFIVFPDFQAKIYKLVVVQMKQGSRPRIDQKEILRKLPIFEESWVTCTSAFPPHGTLRNGEF